MIVAFGGISENVANIDGFDDDGTCAFDDYGPCAFRWLLVLAGLDMTTQVVYWGTQFFCYRFCHRLMIE